MKINDMETTQDRINRIYCEGAIYYNSYCRMLDALTDEEVAKLCKYFDSYDSDAYIFAHIADIDEVAQILNVEPSELENRI